MQSIAINNIIRYFSNRISNLIRISGKRKKWAKLLVNKGLFNQKAATDILSLLQQWIAQYEKWF
mgnify:FL=1